MWGQLEYFLPSSADVEPSNPDPPPSSEQRMDVEIETLRKIEDIATGKYREGKYSEALQLLQVARPTRERVNGERASETLQTISNLGTVYCKLALYSDAEAAFKHVLSVQELQYGTESFEALMTRNYLAVAQKHLLRMRDAELSLRAAFKGLRALQSAEISGTSCGGSNEVTIEGNNLSKGSISKKNVASNDGNNCSAGESPIDTSQTLAVGVAEVAFNLGVLYVQLGKRVAASYYFQQAAHRLTSTLGLQHVRTADAVQWASRCSVALQRISSNKSHMTSKKSSPVKPTSASVKSATAISEGNISNEAMGEVKVEEEEEPSAAALQAETLYESRLDWRSSSSCALCREAYGFLLREHHCRCCAQSVCCYCCDHRTLVVEYDVSKRVKICRSCARQGF